jgi:hypothetical protein
MATTTLRRFLATAFLAAPLPLAAQATPLRPAVFPGPAPLVQSGMVSTPSAAPAVNATRVGLSRSESAVVIDAAEADRLRKRITRRNAQTLMIVGTAAFVAGLLIGDDVGTVMAVGGATAGLIGLYNYLQ